MPAFPFRIMLVLLAASAGACKDAVAPDPVRTVALDPSAATIAWGDTLRLMAPAVGGALIWSSSDTTVLRVDAGGLVTALRGGAARISARAPGVVATADVAVEARFTRLAAGRNQTCGIVPSGTLLCWGAVTDSANGAAVDRLVSTPLPAIARGRFRDVSVARGAPALQDVYLGSVVCATRVAGETLCWGRANQGDAGTGQVTYGTITAPTAVAGAPRFAALRSGYWHACGLAADGAASCWGALVVLGTLGPIPGNAICVGGGSRGSPCQTVPASVASPPRLREIAPGYFQTCAVADDARLWCWGAGTAAGGQTDEAFIAVPPHPLDGDAYATVASGMGFGCAITTPGELRCWGRNVQGRLGRGTTDTAGTPVPAAVASGERFRVVSAGEAFACAITTGGRLFCWGANEWGQLGDGTTTDRTAPVAVASTRRFVAVAAGLTHACALDEGGAAFCWGDARRGQLGHGVTIASSTPVRVVPPE